MGANMAKVLVVDDSTWARTRMVHLLQEAGHRTAEAESGHDAVLRYAAEKPDLVLMDITMPGMDGIRSTAMIRQQDPAARVVMVTAARDHEAVLAAVRAGATDYVLKPYQPERVLEAIQRQLSRNQATAAAPVRG